MLLEHLQCFGEGLPVGVDEKVLGSFLQMWGRLDVQQHRQDDAYGA